MSARMIVHHPYRTLEDLAPSMSFQLSADEKALSQSIINDHYNTDLPLLYPPHVIAITAIFIAVVLRPTHSNLQAHAAATNSAALQNAMQAGLGAMGGAAAATKPTSKIARLVEWLAESQVDMTAVITVTQELFSLYQVWEGYGERFCKEAISRFMKDAQLGK